jgi:putative FmdB family regulatory protein
MPIYEFNCQNCGKVEVLVQSSGGDPICPGCGVVLSDKLFSVPSVARFGKRETGKTCCGALERCSSPPCSSGDTCRRAV